MAEPRTGQAVARKIGELRRLRGLTQQEAAETASEVGGFDPPWGKVTWSAVECHRRSLNPDELRTIATVLRVSVGTLFGEDLQVAGRQSLELLRDALNACLGKLESIEAVRDAIGTYLVCEAP